MSGRHSQQPSRANVPRAVLWSSQPPPTLIILLTNDPTVMGPNRTSRLWLRAFGWTTAVVMTASAIAMFVTAAM